MEEIVEQLTYTDFLNEFDSFLKSCGFEKDEDIYSKVFNAQQPGATISINGQVMQQPGRSIPCKYICENTGEGWIDDIQMSMIRFYVEQGEEIALDYVEGIYLNEIESFKNLCNQYFK